MTPSALSNETRNTRDEIVTRPIIGIENRTAQEVFDIMCDRFRAAPPHRAGEAGPDFDGPYNGPFTEPFQPGQAIRWQVKCSNIADEWFTDEGSADQWANSPGHYDAEVVIWTAHPALPHGIEVTEERVERAARAIYDAEDRLSGDAIATVIISSDHLYPAPEHFEGNPTAMVALREALEAARTWHEAEDKALSKQPPSHGPNGNQWARLQHQEQIAEITAALSGGAK